MLGTKTWHLLSKEGILNSGSTFHYFLSTVFRFTTSLLQWLPSILAGWASAIFRLLFLSLLGFTAWIRSFPGEQFAATFSLSVMFFSVMYAYYMHCKEEEISVRSKKALEREDEIKRLCGEAQQAAQEVLKNAHQITDDEFNAIGDQNATLRSQVVKLTNRNKTLEREIRTRRNEALSASREFQRKLDEMENVVESMTMAEDDKRIAESQLEAESEANDELHKTVAMLHETIEVMKAQRKQLVAKHASATTRIRELTDRNNQLRKALIGREEKSMRISYEDDDDLHEMTQRIQSSLSFAKGKLHRVGGVLRDELSRSNKPVLTNFS